jgi:hypothetical protein
MHFRQSVCINLFQIRKTFQRSNEFGWNPKKNLDVMPFVIHNS